MEVSFSTNTGDFTSLRFCFAFLIVDECYRDISSVIFLARFGETGRKVVKSFAEVSVHCYSFSGNSERSNSTYLDTFV